MFLSRKVLAGGGLINPVLTYVSSNSRDGSGISSYTFSSQDIGSDADGEFLVIVTCVFNGGTTVNDLTDLTVGGASADLEVATSSTPTDMRIFTIAAPAGSTADIEPIASGNNTSYGIGVYRLNAESKTPNDTDTVAGGSAVDMVLSVPKNGAALAGRLQSAGTVTTWTGLTKDFDFDIRSNEWFSGAHADGLGEDATYDISVDGTPAAGSMVAASWA